MKNKLNKILCLTLALIILMFSPIGSYVQGENAKAYALETTIDDAIAKYLLPVSAFMAWQYNQALKGVSGAVATVTDLNNQIAQLDNYKAQLISSIPSASKAIVAYLYTSLTTDDINSALGTTYTPEQLQTLAAPYQSKLDSGTLGLTYDDIFGLGISHLFANSIKLYNNDYYNINKDITYELFNDCEIYTKSFSYSNTFYCLKNDFNYEFLNLLGTCFVQSQIINEDSGMSKFTNISTYTFPNIRFRINSVTPLITTTIYADCNLVTAFETSTLSNDDFYGDVYTRTDYLYIDYKVGDVWTNVKTYYGTSININLATLLNDIKSLTSIDLTDSEFYSTNYTITDIFNLMYEGSRVINSSGSISLPLTIPAVGVGYFAPDTTISDAERLITATGTTTNTYDLNIGTESAVNDDPDTNVSNPIISEITVAPTDTTTYPNATVDTANPDITIPEEAPDTGGTFGEGIFNIPILGAILAALQALWDLLKSLFDTLVNFFTTQSAETNGVDWGNFKGFFDIFYIFYYLIIIVILILLKFLVAVFGMINIPANTALFDSYPTMLAGINYLKNLKIGGFNITLQQIFEYMFTVFFFLFIVTVLQKLYHGFTSVERQQARESRDIKVDTNIYKQYSNFTGIDKPIDINTHYSEYSSFNQDVYNREIYGKKDKSDMPVNMNENINYEDLR